MDGNIRKIKIKIAGRIYPMSVEAKEEEVIRRLAKKIDSMIRDFEENYELHDKQDALALCLIKIGADAEIKSLDEQKKVTRSNEKLMHLNEILQNKIKKKI